MTALVLNVPNFLTGKSLPDMDEGELEAWVAKSLRDEAINKGIFTKNRQVEQAKLDKKRSAPRAPAKAGKVTTSNGSKQYSYPEANPSRDRKGGAKKPAGPGLASPADSQGEGPPLAKRVDPGHMASLLHLDVSDLRALANKLPVEKFVTWFKVHYPVFMKLHKVPRTYLEELHEALTHGDQPKDDPVVKALRGHKAYTRRSRSGKMSVIAERPGERKMDKREIEELRRKHVGEKAQPKSVQSRWTGSGKASADAIVPSVMAARFKMGDTVKHEEMGLGVVCGIGAGQPNLLSVSFNSLNEKYAEEHAAEIKKWNQKYGRPVDTVTSVGAQFVTKVKVKPGGKTDALRARIMKGVRH